MSTNVAKPRHDGWELAGSTPMKTINIATMGVALTIVAGAQCLGSPIRRPEPPRPSPPAQARFYSRTSQPVYNNPPTNYNQTQNLPLQYGTTYISPGFIPSYEPTYNTTGIPSPYDSPGFAYSGPNFPSAGTRNLESTYSYTSNAPNGGKLIRITNKRSVASPDQILLGHQGYVAVPEHSHNAAP